MSGSRNATSWIARQRLADALEAVGPQAPTLCDGWAAHDLAAHLVVREHRPDGPPAILGEQVPVLGEHGRRLMARYRARPFAELLEEFRRGPGRASMFRVPPLERLANAVEFPVHLQDVLRAQPDPHEATELLPALPRTASLLVRPFFRRSPVGVLLVTGGARILARAGVPRVVLRAEPTEVLLLLTGRARVARYEVLGSASHAAALRSWLTRD